MNKITNHLKIFVMRSLQPNKNLAIANCLYAQTARNSGITINQNFESPIDGYLVSIKDGLCFDSVSKTNEHEITAWISNNIDFVSDGGFYFGGWKDAETGKMYFDISANVKDQKKAIDLAKQNNQIAVWDLNENKEIRGF